MTADLRAHAWTALYRGFHAWCAGLGRVLPDHRAGAFWLEVPPTVYRPVHNEWRVAAHVPPGRRVLDAGSGSGVMAIALAPTAREVVAVDVEPAAARATAHNARRAGAEVRVLCGDVFALAPGLGRFGAIVCSPPFSERALPAPGRRWATAPGFADALFALADAALEPDGVLVVHHLASRAEPLRERAAARGLRLRAAHANHAKSLRGHVQAALHLQPGLRTAFFVFTRGR